MIPKPWQWPFPSRFGNRPAIVDVESSAHVSYRELDERIASTSSYHGQKKKRLVAIFARNDLQTLILFLSYLRAGHSVYLLDANHPTGFDITVLQPDLVAVPAAWKDLPFEHPTISGCEALPGFQIFSFAQKECTIHKDLAVVLATSGSSGLAKHVRLSYDNLNSNSLQIKISLNIEDWHRTITTLPMSYSYGLSVILSHLYAGAAIVLENRSVVQSGFWDRVRQTGVVSFAGVPYMYQMLRELNFDFTTVPSIRRATQAGGHLDALTRSWIIEECLKNDVAFYQMYGQTEATARIAVLRPEDAQLKNGSVGRVVPQGTLLVSKQKEIVYHGPNVMLGYAQTRQDLSKGDELNRRLNTGDIGYLDDQGFLFVTGRSNRIAKIAGVRLDLDGLARSFDPNRDAVAISDDKSVWLFVEGNRTEKAVTDIRRIFRATGLPLQMLKLEFLDAFPRTANGKIHYDRLNEFRS